MLTQKGLFLRSLGNFTRVATDRLTQPASYLASEAHHKARLFNILLLVEAALFLIGLGVTFFFSNSSRLFSATALLFTGAALTYAVAKGGRLGLAAWLHALSVLASLAYYNLLRSPDDALAAYLDFRPGCVLLILPVLLAGITLSNRLCLAITGFLIAGLLALGFWTVPVTAAIASTDLAFYNQLFRIPLALILIICLSAITFERNNLTLFNRLNKRNYNLKTITARLAAQADQAEKLIDTLKEALIELENTFSHHQELAKLQVSAALEIEDSESQLTQSSYRLNTLVVQATDVIGDSQAIVLQRAETIRTNSAVYNRLQQLLELINHSVEELSLAAVQIEQVVGSISEVAEETNLLALNASIEAAGHMEQGRRFTMVAAEVYRLAIRARDAAEEVRQVANEVQGSVAALAKVSSQGRNQAQELAQSARSAPLFIDQLTYQMDSLGKNSKSVFVEIQELQNNLREALIEFPVITAKSEEISELTNRLLDCTVSIRQALDNLAAFDQTLTKPAALKARTVDSAGSEPQTGDLNRTPFQKLSKSWNNNLSPGYYSPTARRRQSRLLNNFSMSFSLFLAGYSFLLLLTGFEIASFLPATFFLVLLLLVFALNKTGFQDFALIFFFGSNYIFYNSLFLLQKGSLAQIDCIRVSSGLFCITIFIAVIIADLRWLFCIIALSVACTIGLAYTFIDRPFAEVSNILIFPLIVQLSVGLLAGFLYYNTNRQSALLDNQNREIAFTNRKLQLKKGQVLLVAGKFTGLVHEIDRLFKSQAGLSRIQLDELTEIINKIESLELKAFQLGGSIQQTGQIVGNAREQVQQVMRETDAGSRILEEFRAGVGQIASNSQDLKIHAGEIGQIFELITTVADEIDLLALNATLEAAQAREAGKRFGAVAGEIQRLAGRARQTGARVQMVISNVQEAVSLCTQLTERGHSELLLLTQSAYDTTFSARTVVEVVGTGQKLIGQVEVTSRQQAQCLQQLNRQLREVVTATRILKTQSPASFEIIQSLQEVAQALAENEKSSNSALPVSTLPAEPV